MHSRGDRSKRIRVFNCICSLVLICSLIYVLAVGFEKIAVIFLVASVFSAATPVVIAAEGVSAILIGVFEALAEGLMLIVEGIANIVSSLFG